MKKSLVPRIISHAILSLGALTMIIPFLWMISTSLKDIGEVFIFPPTLFGDKIRWENYLHVFERFPFHLFFLNSLKITLTLVLAQLITCSLAAYVFARLQFRLRDLLFGIYLATLMVPAQVTIIPNFILMRFYDLVDTHAALILPNIASAFGTFLLRQYFLTIPTALEDAAKIDGCTPFGVYWRIYLPLSKPALATLGVFIFMGTWNDFLSPLIFINSVERMTLPLELANMQGLYSTDWPVLMAGTVLSLLPIIIVFFLAQEFIIKGVTLSGLKDL
ncbi:MAG: carbohydrate ABC transporter permease [Novibacillus thermophilus]